MSKQIDEFWTMMKHQFKSHPWHGIEPGENVPQEITTFIEVVPTDTVKYEIDKVTGYLKVDRPQKFSNIIPALYGFIPKTYCAEEVADFCMKQTGRSNVIGDHDPLDVCVLTERQITHGNIQVPAIPIGGFRMIDNGEADDKIIAILKGDEVYQQWTDIESCPDSIIARLKHYFLTYKDMPGQSRSQCEITHIYDREEAHEVIRRSMKDYQNKFGHLQNEVSAILPIS